MLECRFLSGKRWLYASSQNIIRHRKTIHLAFSNASLILKSCFSLCSRWCWEMNFSFMNLTKKEAYVWLKATFTSQIKSCIKWSWFAPRPIFFNIHCCPLKHVRIEDTSRAGHSLKRWNTLKVFPKLSKTFKFQFFNFPFSVK